VELAASCSLCLPRLGTQSVPSRRQARNELNARAGFTSVVAPQTGTVLEIDLTREIGNKREK
jgi:hypothetical protein